MFQNIPDSVYGQTTRWVLTAMTVAIILGILWTLRSILLLTLASVILVVAITIPVRFLERFNIRRVPAIAAAVIGTSFIVYLLARAMLPTLIEQFATLTTETIPRGAAELMAQVNSGEWLEQSPFLADLFQPLFEDLNGGPELIDPEVVNELLQQLAAAAGQIGVSALPLVGDLASTFLSVLIVIFLSMYFLIDPKGYTDGMIRLFPLWYRSRVREILKRIDFALRGWLEGTLLSMVFVGVGTWLGLSLLRLEQAAALGVLAGLLSFVPNFGQLIAVIAAVVVGIVQAPENLLWIIIVIYGMSFIQSQIFTPLLFAESIKLPPVIVLLGQIVSGALFGFIGILLAVPIASIVLVVIQEVYIKDILGDRRSVDVLPAEHEIVPPDEDLLPDGV